MLQYIEKPWKRVWSAINDHPVWKSYWLHGLEDTPKNRNLTTFNNVFLHVHPSQIEWDKLQISYTFGMGGITFLLFILLVWSGVVLMFYYRPTAIHAYDDIKDLQYAVTLGFFMRNFHRWTAHGMVITVVLHMARVFYTGAYKAGREWNWVIGVILLVLTLLLSFSGYLLPWDQISIWAVTVGTNMARATPFLGSEGPFSVVTPMNDARFVLLGSYNVGENALLRFYVLHCVFFPVILSLFLASHLWRVRKNEFSGPRDREG